MRFKRIYHPCTDWEEITFNMWGDIGNRDEAIKKATEFTSNHKLYGKYMGRVVSEWPISCENALTDYTLNRRAWVGHAAVALALGIPEDITRAAWSKLSNEQQFLANEEASAAIRIWENSYFESKKISFGLGGEMLQAGDTGGSPQVALF